MSKTTGEITTQNIKLPSFIIIYQTILEKNTRKPITTYEQNSETFLNSELPIKQVTN